MAYTGKNTWTDRNVAYPKRYTITKVGGGAISSGNDVTMDASPGTVTAAGTQITAAKMNNLEDGVEAAWRKIGSGTTGADANTVEISIPSGYTDIRLVCDNVIVDNNPTTITIRFNNDSGNNYKYTVVHDVYVDNVTTASSLITNYDAWVSTTVAGRIACEVSNISTAPKCGLVVAHNNSSGGAIGAFAWNNTSDVISTIKLICNSTYKIKAGMQYVIEGRV